jgi:Kelch motif
VTEHWSKVGLMHKARAAPAAAVLPDGRVLVAGGYFAFEPDGDGELGPVIDLAAYRTRPAEGDHGSARLDDVDAPPGGRAMATAELFDPRNGTWSTTGSMRYARAGAVAVTLSDGRVLVFGSGTDEGQVIVDDGALVTAEVYDPATGRFSLAGGLSGYNVDPPAWAEEYMGGGGVGHVGTLVALDDGGALLVGHAEWVKHSADFSSSYRFDPTSNTWPEIGEAFVSVWDYGPRERSWSSSGRDLAGAIAVKLADGQVLVAGGGGMLVESQSSIVRTARRYDPATRRWVRLPKMPLAKTGATAVLLDDGSVLVIGGGTARDPYDDSRSTFRFTPSR